MLTFLVPPEGVYLNAVAKDFTKTTDSRIPDVVRNLFRTTNFFFSHPETMQGCARLVTYRGRTATDVLADLKRHDYLRRWKGVSCNALLLATVLILLLLMKLRGTNAVPGISYAIALILTGVLTMLANCFLAEFGPRFILPMWEFTIISAAILSGQTAEYILRIRTD